MASSTRVIYNYTTAAAMKAQPSRFTIISSTTPRGQTIRRCLSHTTSQTTLPWITTCITPPRATKRSTAMEQRTTHTRPTLPSMSLTRSSVIIPTSPTPPRTTSCSWPAAPPLTKAWTWACLSSASHLTSALTSIILAQRRPRPPARPRPRRRPPARPR